MVKSNLFKHLLSFAARVSKFSDTPLLEPHVCRKNSSAMQYITITIPDLAFFVISIIIHNTPSFADWPGHHDIVGSHWICYLLGERYDILVSKKYHVDYVVARFSTEVEFQAIVNGTNGLIRLQSLLNEIGFL